MSEQPNILFITTDQQRPDALGCSGHPCQRTPHLDMLAKEGILFDQAYTDCPVCIPARTTMITGIQSHQYGMPAFAAHHRIERHRNDFLGSLMTQAGYQTALMGKTHWHTDPTFQAGFEVYRGNKARGRAAVRKYGKLPPSLIGANEMTPMLHTAPEEFSTTSWAIQESIDWLDDREKERPFFLWTSLLDPHPPNVTYEPYYSMYDNEDIPDPVMPEWCQDERLPWSLKDIQNGNSFSHMNAVEKRKMRGVYYGMVTRVDHHLSRLFGTLMRNGLWENTIIVFTTDHGEMLGDYGTCFKGSMLDPSVRLPFIMRFPKSMQTLRNAKTSALIELADLLPTFCALAGAPCPDDVTGKNILPLVYGEQDSIRDDLHGQINNNHFFHDGRYKYLYFADDGKELVFDKSCDPLDEHDLSENSALLARLRKRFIAHLQNEQHEHLTDGQLLNLHKTNSDIDPSNVLNWMGLGICQ